VTSINRSSCPVILQAVLLVSLTFPLAVSGQKTGALQIAEALVAAFNQHDPAAMAAMVTSDFELYYVNDEGVAELALRGPEQLAAEMTSYFETRPRVESRIAGAIDGPTFVSVREQIVGGQSSLSVYEVRDRLVRRVWYFPAE